MTFVEMQRETELLYESINSSAAPGFTPTEWGYILTVAQRKVVLAILEEGVNKNAFNQLAIEILIRLVKYTAFIQDTHFKNSDNTSAWALNIADDDFEQKFFWILDEYVSTGVDATLVDNIPVNKITFDFYRANHENPFRVPDPVEGYWMLQYNNTPIFITDGLAITGYSVIGVHHPDTYPIASGTPYNGQASCLNVGVHSKIVEEAVKLARMSVTDVNGYQLATADFAK